MSQSPHHTPARVFLVGAGPGDPGLLTVRGAELLRRADVVLYDYLVNPQMLAHAMPRAELVCLGRHGAGRIMSQQEVNERMIAAARAGQNVVRLKAGDPLVFVRVTEECTAPWRRLVWRSRSFLASPPRQWLAGHCRSAGHRTTVVLGRGANCRS